MRAILHSFLLLFACLEICCVAPINGLVLIPKRAYQRPTNYDDSTDYIKEYRIYSDILLHPEDVAAYLPHEYNWDEPYYLISDADKDFEEAYVEQEKPKRLAYISDMAGGIDEEATKTILIPDVHSIYDLGDLSQYPRFNHYLRASLAPAVIQYGQRLPDDYLKPRSILIADGKKIVGQGGRKKARKQRKKIGKRKKLSAPKASDKADWLNMDDIILNSSVDKDVVYKLGEQYSDSSNLWKNAEY